MDHLIKYKATTLIIGKSYIADKRVVMPHEYLEKLYEKKCKEKNAQNSLK